jgi:CRP-like cAMP-binding protein
MVHAAIVRSLSAHGTLGDADLERIASAARKTIRAVKAHRDIAREGERPQTVKIVLEGWVARYKLLADGRRQLVALMIPGDICDANAFILERMDHTLTALTDVRYSAISRTDFENLITASPALAKTLWRSELVTAAIQREWTANVGQRHAIERIAHLFCETFARLKGIGQVQQNSCEFPLTQIDIADATGLTPVHVNRMLQSLRKQGLVELRGKRLDIVDPAGLRQLAMFNPTYLHMRD